MAVKKNEGFTELKKNIKEEKLNNVYLFYGEEEYMKKMYIDKIREIVPDGGFPEFNHIYLNGRRPLSEYDDAWESFPMMSDRKLIVIKDSYMMSTKRKKDGESQSATSEEIKEFWLEKFKRISDDTIVVFDEVSVDKRSVIFKELSKVGTVVEFDYLSDVDLVTWILQECLKHNRKIKKDVAQYLSSRVDPGLNNMANELGKLFDFCGEEIYLSDVERVVSKSMQIITFDLTDAIMAGDAKKAMSVLNDINATSKGESFAILYLLLATFEKILHAKLLEGRSSKEIASALGTAPFLVGKYINCARNFTVEALEKMVCRVSETDLEIKEGKIDDWTALYQYVTECLHFQQKNK